MRIIGVIPARFESSRFPGKVLADLCGKPVLWYVYQQGIKVEELDEVIVATDDERIRDTVLNFRGKAVMTSGSHRSGTDRIAEVIEKIECDLVVNIQGDEPLIDPESISSAITPFFENEIIVMTTLKKKIVSRNEIENPNVVKVVTDNSGNALYFSRSPIPYRKEWFEKENIDGIVVPYKHIGIYVYSREFLLKLARLSQTPLEMSERLEQLRVLEHGYTIKVIETEYESIGIDTLEDLKRVEEIIRRDRLG